MKGNPMKKSRRITAGSVTGSLNLVTGERGVILSNFDILIFKTGDDSSTVKVQIRAGVDGAILDFHEVTIGKDEEEGRSFAVELKQNLAFGDLLFLNATSEVNWGSQLQRGESMSTFGDPLKKLTSRLSKDRAEEAGYPG